MADAPSIQAKFWSLEGMSSKHESLVPGVNDMGNRRPKAKVKGGKTKEVKAAVPVTQPVLVETTDPQGKTTVSSGLLSTDISTLGTDISSLQSKGVTLKDLCAEDKKRIANLIKELARVGEEKENAEHNLSEERQHYQHQVLTLVQQQEAILKEREEVQSRLLEYQSYIVKLQQQQQLQQLLQHQKRNRNEQQQQQQQQQQSHHPSQHHLKDIRNEAVKSNNRNGEITQKQDRIQSNGDNDKYITQRKGSDRVQKQEAVQSDFGSGDKDSRSRDWRQSPRKFEQDDYVLEEPSAHFYINESNPVPIDQSSTLDGLSTHVVPPQSPPPQQVIDKSSSRPLPHRPFTAMIDRQLTKERRRVVEVETGRTEEGLDEREAGPVDGWDRNENAGGGEKSVGLKTGGPVSPEKAELFSRFMGVQSGARFPNEEDQSFDIDEGRREDMGELQMCDKEKAEMNRKILDTKHRGKSEHHRRVGGHHQHHHRYKEHSRPGRPRHPPPATYGAFLPPVMSSTQKSSEIGDYVSNAGDSTMTTLHTDGRMMDDGVGVAKTRGGRSQAEEDAADRRRSRSGRTNREKDGGVNVNVEGVGSSDGYGTRVKRSDSGAAGRDYNNGEGDLPRGTDREFLNYYKNLSASERKEELLKQRAVLLEEQNKLRSLLTNKDTDDAKTEAVAQQERGTGTNDEGRRRESSPDPMSEEVVSGHGLRKRRSLGNFKGRKSSHNQGSAACKYEEAVDVVKGQTRGRRGGREKDGQEGVVDVKDQVEGRTLRGTDGDECVTYCESKDGGVGGGVGSGGGVETVVKRLNYSLLSNDDQGPSAPSDLDKKFVIIPDAMGGCHDNNASPDKMTAHVTARAMVDAGTSISFPPFPRDDDDAFERSRRTTGNGPDLRSLPDGSVKEGRRHKSSKSNHRKTPTSHRTPTCFGQSPGDKTLAVLKIINSLPDNDDGNSDDNDCHYLSPATKVKHQRRESPRDLSKSKSSHHKTSRQLKMMGNSSTQRQETTPRLKTGRSDHHLSAVDSRKSLFVEGGRSSGRSFRNGSDGYGGEIGLGRRRDGRVGGGVLGRDGSRRSVELSGVRDKSGTSLLSRGGERIGRGADWSMPGMMDCKSLKEDRMRGLRKIANGGDDDEDDDNEDVGGDDDETFYDYDNDDDSNIDEILDDLVLSSAVDDFDDDGGCGRDYDNDDNGWREGEGLRGLKKFDEDEEEDELMDSVLDSLNGVDGGIGKSGACQKHRAKNEYIGVTDDDDDDVGDENFKVVKVNAVASVGDEDVDDEDLGAYDWSPRANVVRTAGGTRRRKDSTDKEEIAILEDVFFAVH